jgi:hypothetical protein
MSTTYFRLNTASTLSCRCMRWYYGIFVWNGWLGCGCRSVIPWCVKRFSHHYAPCFTSQKCKPTVSVLTLILLNGSRPIWLVNLIRLYHWRASLFHDTQCRRTIYKVRYQALSYQVLKGKVVQYADGTVLLVKTRLGDYMFTAKAELAIDPELNATKIVCTQVAGFGTF